MDIILVEKFCLENGLSKEQFLGTEDINRDMFIYSDVPSGFKGNVNGDLVLVESERFPENFEPNVIGSFKADKIIESEFDININIVGDVQIKNLVRSKSVCITSNSNINLNSISSVDGLMKIECKGSLFLNSLELIEGVFDVVVGGSLFLPSMKQTPVNFNPIVGSDLILPLVKKLSENFSPTVCGNLNLDSIEHIDIKWESIVGGSINMKSLKYLNNNVSLKAGNVVNLSGLERVSGGVEIYSGNSLVLNDLVDISGIKIYCFNKNNFNKYKDVVKVEELLNFNINSDEDIRIYGLNVLEVITKKGDVTYANKLPFKEPVYITERFDKFSIGNSLKESMSKLVFILDEDQLKDSSNYENISDEDTFSIPEGLELYRSITKACPAGPEFYYSEVLDLEKRYSIDDIIEITKGKFGHEEFKAFFNKK